jgi:hypothetical protein
MYTGRVRGHVAIDVARDSIIEILRPRRQGERRAPPALQSFIDKPPALHALGQ